MEIFFFLRCPKKGLSQLYHRSQKCGCLKHGPRSLTRVQGLDRQHKKGFFLFFCPFFLLSKSEKLEEKKRKNNV